MKLFNILVHMLTETNRHAGQADIRREQLDGKTGTATDDSNPQERDKAYWAAHRAKIKRAAEAATSSKRVLSGIGELSEEGQTRSEVTAVAETAVATLKAAFDTLAHLDNGFTRQAMAIAAEVAQRVDEEDPNAGGETFAAALSRGFSGEPTEELAAVVTLNLCALEWPINEQGVRDHLDI